MSLARERLTLVEIDVDRCTRVYGNAPCTASLSATEPNKCFNTFATCQDVANYDRGSVTLTFGTAQSGLPKDRTVFPALQRVSTRPAELNLSGIDPKTTALGKRARINVELSDFAYHDEATDPYRDERRTGAAQFSGVGYDPAERSTFFAKMLARAPYYLGRPLRVKRGYVGDDPATMATAHYFISGWSGPDSSGRVSIEASDVINLVDGKRTQAPAPSNGKLLAEITETATTATLTPSGIGDLEYPASGLATIGKEIVRYTRSGDTLTLTERAAEGTEAADHDANDVVQQCLSYDLQRGSQIIHDLLTVQGPVDPSYVDLTTWNALYDSWMGGFEFTGIVAKPTAISDLIGELLQHGMQVWWDEIAAQVRFEVVRPAELNEVLATVTDDNAILEGSGEVMRAEDQRASAIFFYHGILDPTQDIEDDRNYRKLVIAADGSSASANEYAEDRIKKMYSRWLGSAGQDATASVISERLITRFRDTPLVLSCALDAKDASIELADLIDVTTYLLPSPTGEDARQVMQVQYRERQGDTIILRAQTFTFDQRYGRWMTEPQADYDTATDTEKQEGAFWMDETIGDFGDGTEAYLWF